MILKMGEGTSNREIARQMGKGAMDGDGLAEAMV